MPHCCLQLEQHDECRSLERELQQLSHEFQQQREFSGGLRFFPQTSSKRIVEPQGCIVQRYAKSDERPLFGRATEDQRRTGKR